MASFWSCKKMQHFNVTVKLYKRCLFSFIGCDIPNQTLGEVVMQDSFQVWDPKQIIRKAKDRHIFLFELYLVFAKEVKDTNGKAKYIYKSKLLVSTKIVFCCLPVIFDKSIFLDGGHGHYGTHRGRRMQVRRLDG